MSRKIHHENCTYRKQACVYHRPLTIPAQSWGCLLQEHKHHCIGVYYFWQNSADLTDFVIIAISSQTKSSHGRDVLNDEVPWPRLFAPPPPPFNHSTTQETSSSTLIINAPFSRPLQPPRELAEKPLDSVSLIKAIWMNAPGLGKGHGRDLKMVPKNGANQAEVHSHSEIGGQMSFWTCFAVGA